jgi:hypothetical protein
VNPAQTLPVYIGELGPALDMTLADAEACMQRASQLGIPWTAWSMHMRCPPNMLVDQSSGGCGIAMPLQLTQYGQRVKAYLQA